MNFELLKYARISYARRSRSMVGYNYAIVIYALYKRDMIRASSFQYTNI